MGQGRVSAQWGAQGRSRGAAKGLIAKQLHHAAASQVGVQAAGSCRQGLAWCSSTHLKPALLVTPSLSLTCAPPTGAQAQGHSAQGHR